MSPSVPAVLHDWIFPLVCGEFEIGDDIQFGRGSIIQFGRGSIAQAQLDESAAAGMSAIETAWAERIADPLMETDRSSCTDLEDTEALIGPGRRSDGVKVARPMIEAADNEMVAQGLIERPVSPKRTVRAIHQRGGETMTHQLSPVISSPRR